MKKIKRSGCEIFKEKETFAIKDSKTFLIPTRLIEIFCGQEFKFSNM